MENFLNFELVTDFLAKNWIFFKTNTGVSIDQSTMYCISMDLSQWALQTKVTFRI